MILISTWMGEDLGCGRPDLERVSLLLLLLPLLSPGLGAIWVNKWTAES